MSYILLQIVSQILNYFEWTSGEHFYLYYDAALLVSLIVGAALTFRTMKKNAAAAGRRRLCLLALILIAFLALEIVFVSPTQQLYNDEYIHDSIAKTIVYDHYAGICSFSVQPHCVNNTAGLLQQPTGWATMLSVAYLIFGVSFSAGFNLVLLLSSISILLMFYVAFMILGEGDRALLATALFAFTPLFLTFSRSTIIDTPELTIFLLAAALMLTYMKGKRIVAGIAACLAIAYTLTIKVDAIIAIPILLVIFLALGWKQMASKKRRGLLRFAALAAFLAAIIVPELIFAYNSWNLNTFGAGPGIAKISLGNFAMNVEENVIFFLGGYGSIITPTNWQGYNLEFPIAYTIFAAIGAVFLALGKRRDVAAALLLWFFIVFVFYTSYYGGEALYGAGDDIRYFMLSFPAIAMMASSGIMSVVSVARGRIRKAKNPRKARAARNKKRIATAIAVILLVLMVSDLIFEFTTVVMKPPQKIYPFSAERFQQQIIEGNVSLIPHGCFVLSYEPTVWNVLNVSNMYADWFFSPYYRSQLLNYSHGCLYLEYSLDCILNTGGYKLDNTTPGCTTLQNELSLQPVVQAPYDKFGWNYTFAIYKILGYKNGTPLYT